jgi:hypothetical protein
MTKAEEDILTALIKAHTEVRYNCNGNWKAAYPSEDTARGLAKRILSCGFSMASRPVDDRQDQEIDQLQLDIEQVRGWSGLPPELRRQ